MDVSALRIRSGMDLVAVIIRPDTDENKSELLPRMRFGGEVELKKGPCYGCEHRTITCHGVCIDYQNWKKEDQEKKTWLKEQLPQVNEGAIKQQLKKIRNRARGRGKISRSGGGDRW